MGFEFINPDDLPPEVKAQFVAQQQAADRAHMEAIDRAHRIESFVYGQDKDGLYALSLLLGQLIGNKVGTVYWQGQVDGLLQERHNVCSVHGVDHDAVALEAISKGSTGTGDSEAIPDPVIPMPGIPGEMLAALQGDLEELDRQMVEYRVSFNLDTERFYCDDCGMMYPTIEDRMLKSPDDCPGCHQRAGQG